MSVDWVKVLRAEVEIFKFPRKRRQPVAVPEGFIVIPNPENGLVLQEYAKFADTDKDLCYSAELILREEMGGYEKAMDLIDEIEGELITYYESFPLPDGGESDFFLQYMISQAVALPVYVHLDQASLSETSRGLLNNYREISEKKMKAFRLGYVPVNFSTDQSPDQMIVWCPEFT